jgi:hypothetical protein
METQLNVVHYWPEESPEGHGWLQLNWENINHQRFGAHNKEAEEVLEQLLVDIGILEDEGRYGEHGYFYARIELIQEREELHVPTTSKDPYGFFDDKVPF